MTALWQLPKVDGDGQSGREYGKLLSEYRRRLVDLITVVKPSAVGFEAAINVMGQNSPARDYRTNESTIRIAYYLCSVTEEVASTMGLPSYEVAISTIKKHVAGHGRAEKRDVIRAVQLLGIDVGIPADDNRADAAAGFMYLSSRLNPKFRPGADTQLFGRRA